MTARPIRQRKEDRLIYSGATSEEIAAHKACAPFDRMARDMERKWGIDRLPELVPAEMAARFGRAMGLLNTALDAADVDAAIAAANNCTRGLQAMDAAATAAGHKPARPDVWQYEYDGFRFGIIRDVEDWPQVAEDLPGLTLFTMREIAVALAHDRKARSAIAEIKSAFPGSQMTRIRATDDSLDDEIPF